MYLNWSIWSPHSLCYSRGVVHGITKPEHKVSNISYCTSFWCSQWPPPPACCPCYWAPWCPAGWCGGGLTVTSTALASWTLLAGSCLLLHWVNVQAEQSSEPLSWKYKNYFSCQTSTNAHNQFLTCCGIIESAKQFLWVENSPSYAQMGFWIGKRTNITATANANNLPWQTDWQLPSQPPAPPAPPPPWPAPACHTPPPPSCHIAAARWMGEPSSRLVWWDLVLGEEETSLKTLLDIESAGSWSSSKPAQKPSQPTAPHWC